MTRRPSASATDAAEQVAAGAGKLTSPGGWFVRGTRRPSGRGGPVGEAEAVGKGRAAMEPPCIPRYRVEHRHPEWAALVVALASTAALARAAALFHATRLRPQQEAGEVVTVDQATEAVVDRRPL